MKWVLLYICFLNTSVAQPLHFYRLAFLPYGTIVDYPIFCYDSNHNGRGELIFNTRGTGDMGVPQEIWMIYEYKGYDSYEPFYQVYANYGPAFHICGVGDFDKDGCTDIVGERNDAIHPDTCFRFPLGELTIFENPHPDSYPTSLSSWYDTMPSSIIYAPGDLDGDRKEEIFVSCPLVHDSERMWGADTFMIYENIGDNKYERVLIHPFASKSPAKWIFGDFDQDGKIELVENDVVEKLITIYENTGDNEYKIIWQDSSSLPWGNMRLFTAKDTDGNGKPEFFTDVEQPPSIWARGKFYLSKWEAIEDNSYKETFIDSVEYKCSAGAVRSKCGDLDRDGIEEIVWSVATQIYVYKTVGDDKYERVWEWENDHTKEYMGIVGLFVDIYDFNKNGYPEIIVSGSQKTSIFEIDTAYGIASNPLIFKSCNLSISPNPIKGIADIRYEIPERSPVSLEVYDVSGRLVRILLKAKGLEQGAKSIVWDGRDDKGQLLSSGVYFIRLKVADYSKTQKVILFR